jgi:anaerobic magnesium-protoporphyrin IX monomethyl ester cyclase
MKTWVCTTLANFYGPFLGAARVYAYVKKQGHDVHFKDLNQDAYFTLLSRDYLEPALERVGYAIDSVSRNRFLREDLGAILLHSSNSALRQLVAKGILLHMPWYRSVKRAKILKNPLFGIAASRVKTDNILYALFSEKEFVLSEIEHSRQVLDKGFFSLAPDSFVEHFYTLLCGKAIIDAAYFPTQFDFGLGFYGTAYSPRSGDILRAVEDERYNFLIPYYRNEVLPLLDKEQPEVVGISITCMFELIPAFTLAHMIKKVNPQIHIVLGGVLVTELADRFAKNPLLWNLFDSLILGPGEHAFAELIECVKKKAALSGVPNIIYKDKDSIKRGDKLHEFDINEACTPEFVSVRLRSGLPLETASGCYWGRCIFCYYPKQGTASLDSKHQKKRVRAMELVLSDIRELRDRYDPLAIGITDSAIHPKRIEAIAEENLRSEKQVKFFGLFRFEKAFKSRAFCRKLAEGGFLGGYVGLESGSQRVNDAIINKGIKLSDAEIIIKNFHDAGLLLHVTSIVGMPGETEEEALMTYDFFKRWHRWLKLDWQVYPLYVLEQSPLAHRASELGLEIMPLPDDFLVESMIYRLENGLSQEKSMSLSISFTEKLRRFMHPLNQIMDIESLKLFLLAQMAKGIPPSKVRKVGLRV